MVPRTRAGASLAIAAATILLTLTPAAESRAAKKPILAPSTVALDGVAVNENQSSWNISGELRSRQKKCLGGREVELSIDGYEFSAKSAGDGSFSLIGVYASTNDQVVGLATVGKKTVKVKKKAKKSKKKPKKRKLICGPDDAPFGAAFAQLELSIDFNDTLNTFSGQAVSEDPLTESCWSFQPLYLYRNLTLVTGPQVLDGNGNYEFALESEPESGDWDVFAGGAYTDFAEELPDNGLAALRCQSVASPVVVIP